MRKLMVSAALALSMVVGLAGPALAHHVVDVKVQTSCEGFVGSAILNVFGGHKYRVTAPGFDTGTITEPGQSHNVTVPFSGSALSGSVVVEIYRPDGSLEDREVEGFAFEGQCEPEKVRYRVVAGMPKYRGDVFKAEPGLKCQVFQVSTGNRLLRWTSICGGHVDSGKIGPNERTFVRLRQLGTPGPAQVLLARR
jgi:hypothetical protein